MTTRRLVFGTLLLLLAVGGCADKQPQPNVLLVLIDTLRQDHLHLYGYERRTSDWMDALGTEGWVFENHVASASQTVPSTLSLLLSRHPAEHGFVHLGPGHFSRNPPLYPEEFLFLAEVFQEQGYATAGFVGNPFLNHENGFAQGFDKLFNVRRDEELTHAATDWLRAVAGPLPTEARETLPFFAATTRFATDRWGPPTLMVPR